MSHFPPTGKKCPGPEYSEISLSGEVKDFTGQQGGIDVDVDLLQGSIPSIPKKQLAADHLALARGILERTCYGGGGGTRRE